MTSSARGKKKRTFFVPFICSKGIFWRFVFYLNVWFIEYTFRIYILLHIEKYYFIHVCEIVYKKTDVWYNEWHRVVQRLTTNDNERQRMITSGTTNDNEWHEWYSEWQRMTMSNKNGNEGQRMTASDKRNESEW